MTSRDEPRIDHVLIYSNEINDDDKKILSTYIKNINAQGLKTYEENGEVLDELKCIKIHAPDSVLENFADIFKITLTKNNPHYKSQKIRWNWFANGLTRPNENDLLFTSGRAAETLTGTQPTGLTQSERIYIVYRIISSIKYGNLPDERGYQQLVKRGILLDVYPLHDSKYQWSHEGPISDRQLLARYWASLKYIFTYQPLNVIEKYYGPEVGFYFAWIGFYVQLLIPAALLGLFCFFAGIVMYKEGTDYIQKEVCESKQMICPVCPSMNSCDFTPLNKSCTKFKIAYVLENHITVDYSILMIFWGVIYTIAWRRKEAMMKMRWNINQVPGDRVTRTEFMDSATLSRISSITGEIEYYFPLWHKVFFHCLSYIVYICMYFVYIMGLMLVILFRLHFMGYGRKNRDKSEITRHVEIVEMFTSSAITITIMSFIKSFKNKLCKRVTDWENPRTLEDYQMRYNMKVTILSFGNIFLPVIYLAYFKGKFFTHPGDVSQWSFFGIYRLDVCDPSGCMVDLSIQIMMLMGADNAIELVKELLIPVISIKLHEFLFKRKDMDSPNQWEQDFHLVSQDRNFLEGEFLCSAIQHGYMLLFMVAFPLAPLFVLVNTVLKIRFSAIMLLKRSRRVVPRYNRGIEQWNNVFRIITILGSIANPLLIAVGSNFVPKIMYRMQHNNSLSGFVNSTLSEFNVDDYPKLKSSPNITSCFYYGRRYPPTHPRKYELTFDFWMLIAIEAIVFIGLENICLLFALFLNYVIPTLPRKVEIKMEYEQEILREMRGGNNAIRK